ncbi:MAG: hypothetical protein P1U47_14880 [Zhongshania sp.]|nr:hypothetical protein [Zhongshania sp.]
MKARSYNGLPEDYMKMPEKEDKASDAMAALDAINRALLRADAVCHLVMASFEADEGPFSEEIMISSVDSILGAVNQARIIANGLPRIAG